MLVLWAVSREDKFGEGVPNLECLARSTMAQSQLLTFATEGSMLKISSQPIRLDAVGVYPNSPGMEAMLTFTSRFGDQVKMHKVSGNCILVPRGMVKADQVPKENDYRSDGPKQLYIEPPLKARNGDQQQALDASLSYLQSGVDHLIEAPTGFGKTFLGVSIAMQLNKPTLIIVTKEDLVHSWKAMLHNAPDAAKQPGMGLPTSMVGHLQADVEIWQGKRFVIGMVHSLAKEGKYAPEVFRHFGLVIFDECHRLGADTFQEVCYLLPARHRLGLSATPDRSDGKDKVFHAHIGPVLVKGTTIPMSPKILRKPTGWQIPDGMPFAPGKMMAVTKMLAKNVKRNAIIVDFVVQAHNADRTVVVMSDLVDGHLKVLFQLLVNAGISGDKIGFYIGQNTNDKNKAKAFLDSAKTKPVVLATYGMTKEGTDVPEWDTLVLASPRSDVKQAIGRVMRTMKGKKQPVVLDLIDYNSIFQAFANSRLKQYYSVKATIVNM